MVDKNQVAAQMDEYFIVHDGNYKVNDDLTVEIDGGLTSRKSMSKLPVRFSKITRFVGLAHIGLTSLEGLPPDLPSNLVAFDNELTNLKGMPKRIGGDVDISNNPLASLEGMSEEIHGLLGLTWYPQLPLLRTLVSKEIVLGVPDYDATLMNHKDRWDKTAQVEKILNKYAGQGRRGSFACKKELVEAGFEGNARW
jgi:hypothetical protein